MDPLSHLYPIHQIGSDGFSWWIGQVVSPTFRADGTKDPKRSGRYKVRIVGHHPKSCNAVAVDDLPWAITMMPVTSPYSAGAVRSSTPRLEPGDWVIGFFLDREQQQPVIMGSIGQVANTGELEEDPDPSGDCKEFKTFLDPNVRTLDQPEKTSENNPTSSGVPLSGGSSETPATTATPATTIATISNLSAAKRADASETNRAGVNWSVAVVTKCGADTDLNNTFTRLLGDMLRDVQQSDGKLGTYLVGKWTGELYDVMDIGRKYVNKAIRIVETFVAKVKGYVLGKIKAGIDDLIKLLLQPNDKGNALTPVTKFFNEMLKSLGCQMKDLGLRLQEFLEDLIFGYLFDLYKAAACQVDKFVSGLLNTIQSLIDELLASILGPIEDILGLLISPLDLIGDAINYVLDLLGISCDGPDHTCKKTTSVSTKCGTNKKEGDFLDRLLDDLNDPWDGTGADWSTYTCEEAYEGTTLSGTDVVVVGGTQTPLTPNNITYNITDITVTEGAAAIFTVTRTGLTEIASSVRYRSVDGTAIANSDYSPNEGILGFSEGETTKTLSFQTYADGDDTELDEDFYVYLLLDSPGVEVASTSFTNSYARCVISGSPLSSGTPSSPTDPGSSTNPPPSIPNFDVIIDDSFPTDDIDNLNPPSETPVNEILTPTYSVVADKSVVSEGEYITYTITTTNVQNGLELGYTLFGSNITSSDIIGGRLSGTFTIEENSARVIVGIEEDDTIETSERLVFAINGTSASVTVLIRSQFDDLSDEELLDELDGSSPPVTTRKPVPPTFSEPITDNVGRIIEIPIDDPGDPYEEPPSIIIVGEGVGATVIPLVDSNGRVTEVRVTNPGSGFKVNTPQDRGVRCIIDAFTMLSPGKNYKTTPKVYVNGELDKAEAVIDTQGFVTSVRILDRETTYTNYPEVIILGGGGYGARFIPSFACLDTQALVKVGSAKIGTGRYIDCP